MNRLIIIGNGFDLAHGLPTGYCDFINDYWKNVRTEIGKNKEYLDNLFKVNVAHMGYSHGLINNWNAVENYESLFTFFNQYHSMYGGSTFSFQNEFFRIISNHSVQNWVEIENIYYDILKSMTTGGSRKHSYTEDIHRLNKEFEEVKKLLNDYLIKRVEETYDFTNLNSGLMEIFQTKTLKGGELNEFFKEISKIGEKMLKEEYQNFLKKRTGYGGPDSVPGIKIANTFLSFNYTSTMKSYLNFLKTKSEFLNEIHGNILDKSNPINFGFGDEMDSHYKQIEDMNNNEYLKNIKSFQYLHTSNYKRLLDLIDSGVFQVYIMGHSCGLSDRTLLNTIFEHENCISIKVFYHEIKDENGKVIKDNYTEITQNISRHFNKKKLMREKIVNKTLCQPLPQIQLPKK